MYEDIRIKIAFKYGKARPQPLSFAEIWKSVGSHLEASVITTNPNAYMQGIHHRMPVILEPSTWTGWLRRDPLTELDEQKLLSTSSDNTLTPWPVGRGVGSIRNNYPSLIDPIEELPREITPDLFE